MTATVDVDPFDWRTIDALVDDLVAGNRECVLLPSRAIPAVRAAVQRSRAQRAAQLRRQRAGDEAGNPERTIEALAALTCALNELDRAGDVVAARELLT